ncbi:MAG: hypothetical protein Q9219_005097 [cf. Caloplaca sp. 3 TL-2023]
MSGTFSQGKRKPRASFLDLFVSQNEINRLRDELQLRQDRKRASSANAAPADPASAPNPAPDPPKPDEEAKLAEDAKPAEEAAKIPWTSAEDIALLALKGQNKTWKEISDVLVGRDKDELRHRFKEIGGATIGGANAGAGGEAAKEGGESAPAAEPKGGKGSKGKQKGEGGKKGQGKPAAANEESKAAPVAAETAVPAPPADVPPPAPVNQSQAIVADRKDFTVKGILKSGLNGAFHFEHASVPEGATTLNGSPIIYLEEFDPLNIDELSFLYNMNCAFLEQRWVRMASKFFDHYGKRIEPEWLQEKFKNCS